MLPLSFDLSRALIPYEVLLIWNRESFSVGAFFTDVTAFVPKQSGSRVK